MIETDNKRFKIGRPRHFECAQDMEDSFNEYINSLGDKDVLTITGVVLGMGLSDKKSLYDYEKRPEFLHSVKMIRTIVENEYEKRLANPSCTGSIFDLKNFGWKDTTETVVSTKDYEVEL